MIQHLVSISGGKEIVSEASKRGAASFFPFSKDPMHSERGGSGSIIAVAEWAKTDRGGRQHPLLPPDQAGGGCDSELALCERGSTS